MRNTTESYEGKGRRIFVSCCRADAEIADPYIKRLAEQEYEVICDADVHDGEHGQLSPEEHLSGCCSLTVFVSERSMAMHRCRQAIISARRNNLPITAVFVEDVKLTAVMERVLSGAQKVYQEGPGETDASLWRLRTGERIRIGDNVFIIGREEACTDYAVAEDKTMSRKHAVIRKMEDGYYISDAGSLNHVTVNENRIHFGDSAKLSEHDVIFLGNEKFIFYRTDLKEGVCSGELRLEDTKGGISHPVHGPVFRIGRDNHTNDLVIPEKKISRNHAAILMKEDDCYLMDLYSSNGTSVNGKMIKSGERRLLHDGDIIGIGQHKYGFSRSGSRKGR